MTGTSSFEPHPGALYSPEFLADPYAYHGHLREVAPVHWHDKHEMWIVTRFEDVNRIARDPATYSSELARRDRRPPPVAVRSEDLLLVDEANAVHVNELIQMDPPVHTTQRRTVNARFLPSADAGAHLCLGQHLARFEGEEYFAALAEHFPGTRLASDGPPRYNHTPAVRSLAALPVVVA